MNSYKLNKVTQILIYISEIYLTIHGDVTVNYTGLVIGFIIVLLN